MADGRHFENVIIAIFGSPIAVRFGTMAQTGPLHPISQQNFGGTYRVYVSDAGQDR